VARGCRNVPIHLTRGADARACTAIAALFAAVALTVARYPHAPVIDDWLYAASVRDLLATGRFRIGELSAVYPLLPAIWGALLSAVFGFSFTVLRLATVAWSAAGCIAVYGLLREMGRSISASLVAALTIALSPAFFLLSSSFMTDAPLVALSCIALYWMITGLERDAPGRWALGCAWSVAAFLVRPLAIGVPIAALVAAVWSRRLSARWIAPVLTAGVAMVALQFAMPLLFGPLDMGQTRTSNLQYALMVPLRSYASWTAHALVEASFPMLPLVVGALTTRRTIVRVALTGAVLGVLLWAVAGELPFPLPDAQTWTLRDMSARMLVPCSNVPRAPWTRYVERLLPAAGLLAAAGVCAGLTRRDVEHGNHARGSVALLVGFAIVEFALFDLLWLMNDRYYTAVAPTLAWLATSGGPVRARFAIPLLLVWGTVSVTGTRDALAYNETVADVTARLESAGVPPWDIDAGWASNGWRLYVNPQRLPPGADRRFDVPYVTAQIATTYVVANCVLPGYRETASTLLPQRTWQGTDRLFVLRKE
jgi:4-amino-4-deoxy-L-arabinose transferase-like glycosyltransferase